MASELLGKLQQLQKAIAGLQADKAALAEQNARLTAENAELRLSAEQAQKERRRAELDVEYLTMSHRLADNPEAIVQTRRHISKLVRNIDRCLEMLKE